ncbi:MAG: MBL fold metallo-hydrolase [Chitinophagales bacterium]|nr:MBL fold metallo-hydrolase [Chitinophagales bacterium]
MRLFILYISFLLLHSNCLADYLVTHRSCNLKINHVTSSETVQHLNEGDSLLLLDEPQVDGYYHVIAQTTGQEGWVYRTLVRRYRGSLTVNLLANNTTVEVRVVDVGPGLCNLIKLQNGNYIIYDAGHFRGWGSSTIAQIKEYIPPGSDIELMVLSHTDADHIGAADRVLKEYNVKKVLWTGYEKSMVSGGHPTATYRRLVAELNARPSVENINLNQADSIIVPGTKIQFDDATITFLCGFGKPLSSWDLNSAGEKINAVSIVMKLEYKGRSVLFCGDAVGRHIDAPENTLIATEKYLLENAPQYLKSTVMIAPHHGADNGSSTAFVDKVQPEAVIFSAGHDYRHPRTKAALRYLKHVDITRIFRTDRGDDEGDGEWDYLRIPDQEDDYNDDNIQIELHSNGTYKVYYLNPEMS